MPQHRAGLRLVAVAAGVDHHLAGDPGGGGGPVRWWRPGAARGRCRWRCPPRSPPGRPARTARRGRPWPAGSGRASSSWTSWWVVQRRPSSSPARPSASAPGAHAGHRPAGGVVRGQPAEAGRAERTGAREPGGPPAGHDDQVVRAPAAASRARRGPAGPARSAPPAARPRSAGRRGSRARRRWEHLGRPGQVQQVHLGHQQERDDGHDLVSRRRRAPVSSATVAMVANRPASAYSVRARRRRPAASAGRPGSRPGRGRAAQSRCSIGEVAVASVTNVTR